MDAEPAHRQDSPEPSIWPFMGAMATGVMFIVAIFSAWGIVVGSILVFPAFVLWAWPRKKEQAKRLGGEHDPLASVGQ